MKRPMKNLVQSTKTVGFYIYFHPTDSTFKDRMVKGSGVQVHIRANPKKKIGSREIKINSIDQIVPTIIKLLHNQRIKIVI